MTTGPQLPTAFALLADEPNAAVDALLAESLCDLPPHVQAASLKLIGQRGNVAAMATVVGAYQRYDENLRELVTENLEALFGGVRSAMSGTPDQQASAIGLIVASGCTKLAYLLADALKSSQVRVREEAALALRELAAHWVERQTARHSDVSAYAGHPEDEEHDGSTQDLVRAVGRAVKSWETHDQAAILEAALWMHEPLLETIQEKLAERRTRIATAINDLLAAGDDPRAAGFVLHALTMTPLREAAARAISTAKEPTFILALLDQTRMFEDPEVQRSCRWIRQLRWVSEHTIELKELGDEQARSLVTLIASIGGPTDARIELYRRVLTGSSEYTNRLVIRQLADSEADAAGALLCLFAGRDDRGVAKLAAEALSDQHVTAAPINDRRSLSEDQGQTNARVAWDACWRQIDGADAAKRGRLVASLRDSGVNTGLHLRRSLTSGRTSDRIRGLRIAQAADCIDTVAEQVYALVHDSDAIVRGMAVAALIHLPGPTTKRLLRSAADDVDPRVQANAIEVLDELDLAERSAVTVDKLDSRHSRVRANAVKSLLRTELHDAAQTLLDMLGDDAQSHRLSALWVVERLNMKSLVQRLMDMSRSDPDRRVQARAQRVLSTLVSESDTDGGSTRRADAASALKPYAPLESRS